MGILTKAFAPKMSHNYVGHESFRTSNPYQNLWDCYTADEYASQYPNIRAIANEYMKIRPLAIDGNGKPVPHPALDALYHPNKKDSSVLFSEKIAVSTLSLPITYILVWRNEGGEAKPGGNFGFKGRNISGYTFLENPAIDVRDGRKYYKMGYQEFNEDEVMELPGGAKPKNLYAGYSPSQAASRWSTLDSYIADFQKGFFENGAIPAGQFIVTSVSKQDYEDTVKKLQEAHRGAGKNNNVTYTPRPVDPNTNKPADAKIEWIPYQQSNKDIDFEPLLKHVDNRLSEAYGVSSIIKGVDSAAKYSNAEVSEASFAKRAVSPLALRNYTQITHELNRITGGLGVAITYKYEIPAVSDAEFVKAKTKNIEVQMINALIEQGYTLDSAVDALELSPAYKLLKTGSGGAVIDNDKPDVDDGDEVDKSPDPTKIDGVTPLNKTKFKKKAEPKLELTDEEQLVEVALTYKKAQVDSAVEALDITSDQANQEDTNKFIDDALEIISRMVVVAGIAQHSEGIALLAGLDLSTDNINDFILTEQRLDDYRSYLTQVADSYSELTTKSIREILETAEIDGLPSAEIKKKLLELPELERYQAQRLARTETVRAEGNGSLFSMEQIQAETGVDMYKVWNLSDNACPTCVAIEAESGRKLISEPFLPIGGSVVTSDDKIIVNDFVDMETADGHPNCRCYLTYEIER